MPTIGANYHFLTDEKKDLYAGGLCCLGAIATGVGPDIEISKDVALGLNLGMDYYLEGSWSVGATLKYIDFGEIDFSLLPPWLEGVICNNGLFGLGHLNNLSITMGVGYKF
jgi:opacity protein-like surface antigen